MNKHTHKHTRTALPPGPCTLQLPEAPVQDGVEADVRGAVTQPASSLHTLGRGGRGGGREEEGGGGRGNMGARGPLTSGSAGGGRGGR